MCSSDLGERASLGNIANVQIRRGRFAEAIAVNQQALDIAQELEDLPGQATALTNFGVIYSAQEDHRSEERRVGKECRSRWSPYH